MERVRRPRQPEPTQHPPFTGRQEARARVDRKALQVTRHRRRLPTDGGIGPDPPGPGPMYLHHRQGQRLLGRPTEQPLALPVVQVHWAGAGWVGADAAVGWEASPVTGDLQRFAVDPRAGFLAPGERRVLGWLRLTRPADTLHAEVVGEQLSR